MSCDPKLSRRRRYRSDLSDTAWARIARFVVPKRPRGGRPCPSHRWREYVDAVLYVLRTGCAWRHLPHDVTVSWSAAHKHFLRWCRNGTWTKILVAVRGEVRTRSGRRRRPSAAVMDSSSVKASPVAGLRGFDGAKKVDGVKRHVLVDSNGVLLAAVVTPAHVQDRAAFPALLRKAKRIAPTIAHVWVDKGYTGQAVTTAAPRAGVTVDIVSGPKPGHGFIVHLAAGSSNAPTAGSTTADASTATTKSPFKRTKDSSTCSQIALLLRRLDRSQLFDTL